ncbi:SusC/RagA family TonB-linked outer membrane protein [Flavobacterium sp.]|uniref:SusC/RagA family TonB-linked outer membrane protein n=1 Tax=Flavobacterium sp. TaxID=239 RepID=UPI00261DCA6B|nr:SusC/RagA family TonB-linked outer membrane protein [Flavobacterium sp.]
MRSKFKWIFTLLVAFTMQFSFAQEKTITGAVTDASGPLPGVNVVVQGTQRGVSTNFDGTFSIKAKEGEKLVFSFMGLNDVVKTVGAANVMNVVMSEDSKLLEVVVVTAVGIKKRQDAITSSNQVVRAKEITQANNPNAVAALAGKVTGLQINNTGNGVKAENRIVLRGARSISGDNQALIVIDNAISSSAILQQLPPDIIESFNVLKGAQGAALYGEQGVNGVIIVTTKKGTKNEKMSVSINSSVDFEEVSYIAERQTRYGQGWSGSHVSYENGAWGAEMDGSMQAVGLQQADGTFIMAPYSPIKDNIKKFFNSGTVFQNGITISGGSLDTGYVSLTANKQTTDFVVKGDALNRSSFIFKAGKKIDRITVDAGLTYITEKAEYTTQNLLTELYQAATNIPVERFEHSGNEGAWTSYYNNPYWLRDNTRYEDRSDLFVGQLNLNYEFNKHINLNYAGQVRFNQANEFYYRNGYVDLNKVGGGDHTVISQFDQSNANSRRYYGDLMLNFDYKLTDKVGFKLNLGQNLQDNFNKITSQGGDNLTIPGFYNIANITGLPRSATFYDAVAFNGDRQGVFANGTIKSRRMGLFANLDLDYNDILFFNATARNDWNSNFVGAPVDNYFYPSAGISFVPTSMESLKDGKVVNYAKIAASVVRVGNSSVLAPYAINDLYQSGFGYPYGSNSSFGHVQNPTDSKITPEFMLTKELSGALGFFKDRVTLEGSVYQTVTTDLITRSSASSASGLASILTNVGQMTTTGFEVDLGFSPIKNANFRWDNRIGYSHYKSIVDKVSDQADEVSLQTTAEVGVFAVKGEEFPLIKGTAYERDPQGRVIIDPSTGNPMRAAGFKTLGKANPDYIINYNTAVEYKGIRLAAVMDYRTGHQFYSGTKDWISWSGHLYESAINGRTGFIYPNSVIETSPGVYTENTSVVTGGNTYSSFIAYFQDEYADIAENSILDATALKIREISLSYTLPAKMLESTKLASVKFGVNARNPFVFLPKENRGYSDPEFSNTIGNAAGISNVGKYPQTRTFGFNVNVTF